MISNKRFDDPSYKGWVLPETCDDINGTPLERHYDTTKTKSDLLASDEWKVPSFMTMNDGRPVTKELWPERRKEILDILMEYGFGYTPEPIGKVRAEVLWSSASEENLYAGVVKTYAGKAVSERIMLTFDAPYGEFSFPIQVVRPIYAEERPPVVMQIAFKPRSLRELPVSEEVDHRYAPVEEIIDNGFAYVQFSYCDTIGDLPRGNYKEAFVENGMGKFFCKGDTRGESEWGKVGMWAYCASRVLDYLLTRDDLDHDCISVAGHSRLGKTALWAVAQDERFFAALVNGSGFGGAGLMKGLTKRRLLDCIKNGSIDWWCEKQKQFAHDPCSLPYDSHFILAAIAPRYVNLIDGDGDFAKYQLADFMAAAFASPAFEVLGLDGFISSEELPRPSVIYNDGHIGYALRPGSHYFSRWDWNAHMEFVKKHRGNK